MEESNIIIRYFILFSLLLLIFPATSPFILVPRMLTGFLLRISKKMQEERPLLVYFKDITKYAPDRRLFLNFREEGSISLSISIIEEPLVSKGYYLL